MIMCEVNAFEDVYSVISSGNKSKFKGTKAECEAYLSSQTDGRFSQVKFNLLTRPNYSPYCGNDRCRTMPRTVFNGEQFKCTDCNWVSSLDPEFIKLYKEK